MVAARSVAMAFNRLIDAAIDAENPRTMNRHIPAGSLSKRFTWGFLAFWTVVFLVASGMLNWLCLQLAPLALAIVMGYSYCKRFTSLAHLVLGFSLGVAPAAAWIAMQGSLDPRILWLTAAVTLWTAGFDIIYACQDYAYDIHAGLHSIPQRFGISGALWISRVLHLGMLASLILLVGSFALGALAIAGIVAVAGLLAWEHRLVRADDLSKIDAAFFTMNGYVSVVFFLFWAGDIFLQ
jgi:4-hydroxybenzoate polyprenyltransferase